MSCPPGTTRQDGAEPVSESCVDPAGRKQGLSRWRSESGMAVSESSYWQALPPVDFSLREWVDDELEGLATDYVNGAKSIEGRYKGGLQDGVWCQWDKETLVGQYSMDMGTGTETLWYGKDRPSMQRQLSKGVAHGFLHTWHAETGAKALDGQFVDGQADGKWTQYDQQGAALGSYMMRQGTGIQRTWSLEGKLVSEVPWVKGTKQGPSIFYWPHGKVMKESPYLKGRLHGVERWYNEDGSLEREQRWVEGHVETAPAP